MGDTESIKMILLVDDDKNVQRIHKQLLEQMGYQVVVANNGVEALSEFRRNTAIYDILVSDFQMPEMDGLALIEAIRNDGHRLPILMVSGYVDHIMTARLIDFQVKFTSKPLRFNELSRLLRNTLPC
ncbi:MAG: response regulator [Mariprofundaceae bacterium]